MNYFPASYSTLSSSSLLNFTKNKYSIAKNSEIQFLKRGFNDTYLIYNADKKYILRVYKSAWRTKKSIENETSLLNQLLLNGISVSYPIKDDDEKYIQEINCIEGVRYIVLFSFAEGEQINKLSLHQSDLLGKEIGKMHRCSEKIRFSEVAFDYNLKVQFDEILKTVYPILKNYPKQYEYLVWLKNDFTSVFDSINKEELSRGICHGDIQKENYYFKENQITFFDFDFFGNGYLAYDIGVFIWYDHKNKSAEIIKAFLNGYQEIKKLTSTEIKMIPYFSSLRALFQMTLFCKISNGKELPIWPHSQVAEFVLKVEKWHSSIINKPLIF